MNKQRVLMGFAMLFVSFMFCSSLFAQTCTLGFRWTKNTESNLAGYRLYQRFEDKASYSLGAKNAIATIDPQAGSIFVGMDVKKEGRYFWILTAFNKKGVEFMVSNEVTFFVGDDSFPLITEKLRVKEMEIPLSE